MKQSLFILFISLTLLANAQQAQLKGKIIDTQTGEPLSFASVKVDGINAAVADSSGLFTLDIKAGKSVITISKVGYSTLTQTIRLNEEDRTTIQFSLERYTNELERVVVSGSKQEKQLAREVVSITSVQPYLIANTNSNTLSDVLNRVPGVSVVEGQAMIRGSAGWSYNVGSRVMVLLDDMPLMGPDMGDVHWDLLPIEAAENIEVMKGPASVLYGSSASSGTVSVRTGWPTNKPQTQVRFYQGITDNPHRKYAAWWERTSQPFNTGTFFTHKQKFGQFDLVMSGNLDANRSYIEQNDQFRGRTYFKTRYRFKSIPGLSAGINGNLMLKKGGRYFLWSDADTNILRPFQGSSGEDFYRVWSIDPHIVYVRPDNYTISLRLRHYNITRFGDPALANGNDAVANMQSMDINFQKKWLPNLTSTAGVYLSQMWAVGNVYSGNHTGYTAAAFAQAEYLLFNKLTLNAGLRYEVNALGPIEQSPGPLLRAGINYQAAKKTFLRATYGEGFRFPTVGERYVEDKVKGLSILPNPGLKSEFGWYTEFGIKQGFKLEQFNFSVDYAFFWQEYQNLIQFEFKQWKQDSFYIDNGVFHSIPGEIGFRAINIETTRSAGMEITLEGEGRIREVGIRTLCGYTYIFPVDLKADPSLQHFGNYMSNFFSAYNGLDDAQLNSILPYRNRKLVKIDIELSYKKAAIGYGAFYYSTYDKIDAPLYDLIPGMRSYIDKLSAGDWVHNVRCSYQINPYTTLAVLVNNITNREYSTRPARIEQPRSFNLQLRLSF